MTAVLGDRREKSAKNIPPESSNLPQNEKNIVAAALISATSEMARTFSCRDYDTVELLRVIKKDAHGWWNQSKHLPALRDRLGG